LVDAIYAIALPARGGRVAGGHGALTAAGGDVCADPSNGAIRISTRAAPGRQRDAGIFNAD
jgi:hypothetical protein